MEKDSKERISVVLAAHGYNIERYRYARVNCCWLEILKPKAHLEKRLKK